MIVGAVSARAMSADTPTIAATATPSASIPRGTDFKVRVFIIILFNFIKREHGDSPVLVETFVY